jgi:hypothetical protein
LFAVALFPVSDYVGIMAMGTLDSFGYFRHSIVFLRVFVVFTPPSYFVEHHQKFVHGLAQIFTE